MAKEEPKPKEKPEEVDDFDAVFEEYGIEDEEDRRRARVFAAAREIHRRRSTPKEPEKKKSKVWD